MILRPPCRAALTLWVALLSTFGAHADEPTWGLNATGLAGASVADGDRQSARVTIEPSLKWKLQHFELRARERVRWLDLQGDQRIDADVRELTVSWRESEATLTLGAQQVNWGRMDILRVTDIINPVDQNDLFYEELTEAKLALWMANLEWQSGSQTLQVIASPQIPVDRFPSYWNGLPVRVPKPGTSINNTTMAVRYGLVSTGWNADFMVVRGWQSSPSLQPINVTTGLQLQGTVSRQNSIGFSADKPLGAMVLRLEGLYARRSPPDDASSLNFRLRRQASLGAGLDFRASSWFFAGQVVVQHDRDTTAGSGNNAFVSAIIQRKWLQDRLSARGLHILEIRSGSSWSSLQMAYELSPNQLLQLQGDWFKGDTNEAFGNFKQRSRIAASVRLLF